MRYFGIIGLVSIMCHIGISQSDIDRLVTALKGDTPLEEDLQELCDYIGGRITGSSANEKAVYWAYEKWQSAGVFTKLHAFDMPAKWIPGETKVTLSFGDESWSPSSVSKYMSPPGDYQGKVVYVSNLDTVASNILKQIKDNFIMVSSELCLDINGLFAEYGFAKKVEDFAMNHGAKGIIFMASRPQKLLYTFIPSAGLDNKIPHIVMARIDAMRAIRLIENGHDLSVLASLDHHTSNSFESHNVIAEIKGTDSPEEIIVIGSHIDSWALGTGANDNGCNVSLMIDIARQIQKLGIKPRRTIRIALWNGEEQGYFGSWAYTRDHLTEMHNHKMALSVDIGSGAITGFFTNGREDLKYAVDEALSTVSDLGPFTHVNVPIVGTDNFDFMLQGVPNLVANHLPQVYGINYHAQSDTYDKVDLATLKQNSAIIGALVLGLANADLDDKMWSRQNRRQIQDMFEAFDVEFSMRMFNVWEPWVSRARGIKE